MYTTTEFLYIYDLGCSIFNKWLFSMRIPVLNINQIMENYAALPNNSFKCKVRRINIQIHKISNKTFPEKVIYRCDAVRKERPPPLQFKHNVARMRKTPQTGFPFGSLAQMAHLHHAAMTLRTTIPSVRTKRHEFYGDVFQELSLKQFNRFLCATSPALLVSLSVDLFLFYIFFSYD